MYVKIEVWDGVGRKEGGMEGMGEKANFMLMYSYGDLEKGTPDVGMAWRNLSIGSHPCLCTLGGIPTSSFTF